MVPDKFNIVDFGGFDLVGQYGEALPGIYDKIVDAHWNCVYIMCFGLKFAEFDIAPQYMTPEMLSDHVMLNGIISIDRNDVITIPSIIPPPVIQSLTATENRVYEVPEGVDGFNPVTVEVPNEIEYISTSAGDSLYGWYSTRTVTRILEDGQKLIALPWRSNSGYVSMAFYTLQDLPLSDVATGDYVAKRTINGMEFPDGSIHDIFAYGGMSGSGSNPGYVFFKKVNSLGGLGLAFIGDRTGLNYAYGPTSEANGGNAFNAMAAELKDTILNSILRTI